MEIEKILLQSVYLPKLRYKTVLFFNLDLVAPLVTDHFCAKLTDRQNPSIFEPALFLLHIGKQYFF